MYNDHNDSEISWFVTILMKFGPNLSVMASLQMQINIRHLFIHFGETKMQPYTMA